MKLRNIQRKMLKKTIKGGKKGSLPFCDQPIGGGKTVMMSQILEDIDSGKAYLVSHQAPVRDWSLEPIIKKGVMTFNYKLLGEGIIQPDEVYTLPAPGQPSLALHAQWIGRIKRVTPTGAGPDFDANIQGPSLADLIDQGYLVPPPATFYLTDAKTGEKIEGSEFTPGKKDDDQ